MVERSRQENPAAKARGAESGQKGELPVPVIFGALALMTVVWLWIFFAAFGG